MKIDYGKIKSQSEYNKKMGLVGKTTKTAKIYSPSKEYGEVTYEIDLTDVIDGKNEAAYKEACENRRFEIEMYWKRAGYFWAFIVSIYTAVFAISTNEKEFPHKHSLLAILSFLGFVFCLGFYLANKGSKNWQENWEQHVNLLEDNVAGQLYKIFIRDEPAYSVSKINKFLSFVLVFVSGGFFVVQTVDFLKTHFAGLPPSQLLGLFIVVLLFAILVCVYMKCCLLGNQSEGKEFNFVNAKIGN